eukprot:scaffold208132_cov29-Tisochrysis_lutea.AAC.5
MSVFPGVLLLVDAAEGPKPQTRFVLKKALGMGHKILVVVNKIDKPAARPDYVIDKTFDLFVELGASDEQVSRLQPVCVICLWSHPSSLPLALSAASLLLCGKAVPLLPSFSHFEPRRLQAFAALGHSNVAAPCWALLLTLLASPSFQTDFPIVYTSAINRQSGDEPDTIVDTMEPLFKQILQLPAPAADFDGSLQVCHDSRPSKSRCSALLWCNSGPGLENLSVAVVAGEN